MQNFQDKRTRRRLIYSQATILILFFLIVLLSHAVWGIYKKKQLTQSTKATVDRELAFLLARKQSLESDLERLESTRGIESELRSKFQIARPHEEVIVVIDEAVSTSNTAAATQTAPRNFWLVIKDFFLKR